MAAGGVRQADGDIAAERFRVDRARRAAQIDFAGERLDLLRAANVFDVDVARKHRDVEADVRRHFDVEVGLYDVVVAVAPTVVFLVRFDQDAGSGFADLETNVVEPVPVRAPDSVDGHVAPTGAGNVHLAGKVLELQLSVRADLHGAVDTFCIFRQCRTGQGGGAHERDR